MIIRIESEPGRSSFAFIPFLNHHKLVFNLILADSITRHTFGMILQLILSRLVKTWYINLRQIRNSTKDVLIETKYRSVNVKQSLFKARWSNSSLCLGLEFCVFISIQDKKECFK